MALEKLKTSRYKTGDRICYEGRLSGNFRSMFQKQSVALNPILEELSSGFQNLVENRNELINHLSSAYKTLEKITSPIALHKDSLKFIKHFDKLENLNEFSVYSLFGIKLRKPGEGEDEEAYITEDDKNSIVNFIAELN